MIKNQKCPTAQLHQCIFFQCEQITARLEVAYVSKNSTQNYESANNFFTGDFYESERIQIEFRRNITVGVGCACVRRESRKINEFRRILEKRTIK